MASLLLPCQGIARADAPATTMFRADAAHLGVYASPAPSLRSVRWRFHTGGSIISSPAVSGGIVYVGSNDGNLYAVRQSDGTRVWQYPTGGEVTSSPAVAGKSVYFASTDGYVYAVAARTGTLRWRFKTAGERRFTAPGIHGIKPPNQMMADPFDMFISSPAVDAQTVYIGSGDRNVYALDARTGRERWRFATGDVVHATPAVAGGRVYVGSWDRYFYALDAATGAVRWKFQTGDDQKIHNQIGIQGSASVADGIVYFGCRDSHLYALDARDGALRWKHDDFGSWVIATPAIYSGIVYFTTSDEHKFFALDAANGRSIFTDTYGTFAYSSPSMAAGVAYFGTFDGSLYAVDARNGKVLAVFQTDGARNYRAAHVNKHGDLDLSAFFSSNTLDGINAGIAHIFALGSIVGAPAIANGVLYVGSADGTLYAIN
ncbi:MAG: PQQ-binding-like beta-propeller repeat protein [Candidatus Eremiobacteraeota bacterium]|nr:PQQ-binding-like beta-propeller repeat protein [Candidatus Eremiobacteraeota bacterium]MBV8499185.1 PQQ-binding-like beta-propeller repeat protein [Candidatus Eremiobacteraeota bacterium]